MKPVIGVYLGWIPPHGETWEPLYRTIRCPGGYHSDRTVLYDQTLDRYPGLEEVTSFYPNPLELPYALERRTPLVRESYERNARFLNLSYPNLDIFEYIGRTGGAMVGDPFTVCPIVEPNDDGSYTYEVGLQNVDRTVRDLLSELTPLKVVAFDNAPTVVMIKDQTLGNLLPHFSSLGDAISNLRVLRVAEDFFFTGGQVLVTFNTSVNLYARPDFAIAKERIVV